MEKIWKEIPHPYTLFRDYNMLTKDLIDQELSAVHPWGRPIADSMGCNLQQKDVIISKAILHVLERLAMSLNSYGLDLAEHCISCPPA